ncbi:MAG: hypothetical protein ACRBDL_05875 [Alphaproteobacteria bacterium]
MRKSYLFFWFLGVFAIFSVMASNVYALSDHCPRQNVKTELKSKLAKTKVYRGTVSSFNDYIGNHDRSQGTVLAFVETDYRELFVKLYYKFNTVEAGNGRYCVQLEKVLGEFYAAPALYMPTDYGKSSCEYKQVLKHEKRHLQAVYDYHKRNEGRYASFLGRISRGVEIYPPVSDEDDIEDIQLDIVEYFEENFREQEIKSLIELAQIQNKIDSPMEYRGVSMRCDRW